MPFKGKSIFNYDDAPITLCIGVRMNMFVNCFPFAVPPHQILVYDASGRDVAGSVGPLLEDNNLVLTCEVRGGECFFKLLSFIEHSSIRTSTDEIKLFCGAEELPIGEIKKIENKKIQLKLFINQFSLERCKKVTLRKSC